MRPAIQPVVIATALLLFFAGQSPGQDQAKPRVPEANGPAANGEKAEANLLGGWRVNSMYLASAEEGSKNFAQAAEDKPVSLVFSATKCSMRLGTASIGDMSYVLDATRYPWTIDIKFKDQTLLGICLKKGDSLKMSLDDRAKGRPRDYDKGKHEMLFDLRRFIGDSLLLMNADGGNPHAILSMLEFSGAGSPNWSHDGSKIAFDAWRSLLGEAERETHIFAVNADGSTPTDLGRGAMPSWSPDDKQLTYCDYGPENRGVCVMNADGSNRHRIDASGWGSRWSPRRNEIVYTVYGQNGAMLRIYDVAKGERRDVPHKPYQQIYWGPAWSPDGKWICFKGILPGGGTEIAAVSVEGEKKGFKVLLPETALPEVSNFFCITAWGGADNQILAIMQKKADRGPQLYVLDSAGVKPPQLFAKFPAEWIATCPAWSPDGKRIVLTAHPANKPATADK